MDATAERPWTRSYAPGVPADIAEPTDSLVDLLRAAAHRFGPRVALDFFGATTTLRRAGRPGRPRGRGAAPARRRARATGWRWCCRTARSTWSPSTPCSGSARWSSSTTRSTPRRSWNTSSPTTAPGWRGVGQDRPAGQRGAARGADRRRGRPDRGAAPAQAARAAAAAAQGPRRPRRDDRARARRPGLVGLLAAAGPLAAAHPAPGPRRHRAAPVHRRHHRHAQGRHR